MSSPRWSGPSIPDTLPDEPPDHGVRPLNLSWSHHAESQWYNRSASAEVPGTNASAGSYPVDYPSAREGTVGYYHPDGDVVLLVRGGDIVSCIDLNDRHPTEQQYVRTQVATFYGVDCERTGEPTHD